MDVPETLGGLGLDLSEEQQRQVLVYLHLRAKISRQQRFGLIVMAIVVVAPWVMMPMFGDQPGLPFQSLADMALRWLPVAGVVLGCAGLWMQHYTAQLLDKQLPQLGMSEPTAQRVRELARSIALVTIWRPLLGAYLFDKLVG